MQIFKWAAICSNSLVSNAEQCTLCSYPFTQEGNYLPSALISSGPCLQTEALGKLASARTTQNLVHLFATLYSFTNGVSVTHPCQHRQQLRREDSWNILENDHAGTHNHIRSYSVLTKARVNLIHVSLHVFGTWTMLPSRTDFWGMELYCTIIQQLKILVCIKC